MPYASCCRDETAVHEIVLNWSDIQRILGFDNNREWFAARGLVSPSSSLSFRALSGIKLIEGAKRRH